MQYETHVIHLDTLLCADSGCTHSNTEAACGAQAPSGSNHGGQRAEAPSGSQSPHHHAVQCAHHRHGPACGHERVPHGNHFDYLVGSELHHPHDDHCDHHGDITVLSLTDIDTSSALGDEADDSSITRSVYAGFAHMQLRRNLARTAMRKAAAARGHTHGGTAGTGEHKGEEAQPDALLHASGEKTKWYHDSDLMRFFLMFFLTGGYFLVELIYGMIIGSLALQADAFHMASDLIALVVGFYSLHASRRAPTAIASYGWTRMEVIGALMNGTFLMATCFNITLEAIHRLQDLDEIEEALGDQADLLMTVALIGLAVNVLGLFIFGHGGGGHGHSHGGGGGHGHSHGGSGGGHGHSHGGSGGGHGHSHGDSAGNKDKDKDKAKKKRNMNVQGVFLHVLGDALGSIGVVIAGVVVEYGESTLGRSRFLADPIASLVIVMLIMAGTVPLVRRCVRILLQHAPVHVGVSTLREELTSIDGVLDVHDFHVWQLTEQKIVCSLHAICRGGVDFMKLSDTMKLRLHRAGIHASTIQPEFVPPELILDLESADVERCHEPMCDDLTECAAAMCCKTGTPGAARRDSAAAEDVAVDVDGDAHAQAPGNDGAVAGHGHGHDAGGHGHSHGGKDDDAQVGLEVA